MRILHLTRFVATFFLAFTAAFAVTNLTATQAQAQSQKRNSNTFAAHGDFFLYQRSHRSLSLPAPASSCRDQIAKVVCVVDPMPPPVPGQELPDPTLRPCETNSERYAAVFETLYDNYPAALQKMFCSLSRIFIEKEFVGTAYAGRASDGQSGGAIIGIRQSVLDEELDLTTWATWKEQLSFGGVSDSYQSKPGLPMIETSSQVQANDFLYFLVAHEFGHLFDFTNELNKTVNCHGPPDDESQVCVFEKGSWGDLSWKDSKTVKPEFDYHERSLLCFYWCNGNFIGVASISQIYDGLMNSNFISLYGSMHAWDDFAESLAYIAMHDNLGSKYVIKTPQGDSHDIMAKISAPGFAIKKDYVDKLLLRSDLKYP